METTHLDPNLPPRPRGSPRKWAAFVVSALLGFPGVTRGAEVLMDNGDPGTSARGTWRSVDSGNTFEDDALIGKRYGSYTFTPSLAPGEYRVHLWWTANKYRENQLPVRVRAVGGDQVVHVDQRINGGRWNLLGTFQLEAGAFVRLEVRDGSPVCADAVRFELVEPPPPEEPPAEPIPDPEPVPEPPPAEPDAPPSPPLGLTATGGDSVVTLDWSDVPDADLAGYRIYRSFTFSGGYQVLIDGVAASTYQDRSVVNGTTYHYIVVSVDAAGNQSLGSRTGTATPAASALPPPPPPPPPPAPTSSSFVLGWDAPAASADGSALTDLAGYKVYVGTASRQYTQVIDVGNALQVSLTMNVGGTGFFAVTAYDSTGNESSFSSELSTVIES